MKQMNIYEEATGKTMWALPGGGRGLWRVHEPQGGRRGGGGGGG